ncbi:polyamine aminopropyltransferase [bacterium SCSIO 12741]|nr:polyamine aminopropyltransferase [bacterium SCSIO 12741]
MKLRSNILKLALFATGLSGIVAEYILSTLATYFLGDSVFQWTLIVSVMLFSMGLGSRISRWIKKDLLHAFILIELVLSLLCSFSSLFAYSASAYTMYTGLIIYSLSILIGLLIGMEIPLVVRLNETFEELRVNIASVVEKDYYGSLAGGLFFAFVGLPYLGLTYTPFIMGAVNLLVALALVLILWQQFTRFRRTLYTTGAILLLGVITLGGLGAEPIIQYGEQSRYKDRVVLTQQTAYQRIVVTQWKKHFWLYLNGNLQFSTLDEPLYHEPLVHPGVLMAAQPRKILVLGGGDGCAVRELLKHSSIQSVRLVDLDPAMTELMSTHPLFVDLNKGSLSNPKVQVVNQDAYLYMDTTSQIFDLILIDLPDPRTVELNRLYSSEFYQLCRQHLSQRGVLVTQAGSPFLATAAFRCIEKTMRASEFGTISYHNHVPTMGEWGWVLGAKGMTSQEALNRFQHLNLNDLPTSWLTDSCFVSMSTFGKESLFVREDTVKVNRIHDPVLYHYFLQGTWDLY